MKSFFRHLFHRGIPRAQKQLDARIGAAVLSWVQGRSYVKNLPTLEEIAGDIGVPSDQLSAYIHVHERRHVLAWRKDLRIRDAMELLRVRTHTAAEIDAMLAAGEFQQSVHALAWLLSKQAP